jgi:SPW repeat
VQVIPTRVHGIIDYLVGMLLIAAPWLLGFADGGPAQWVPVLLGAAAIVYSLLTDYELGIARLISVRAHLVLDALSGMLLLASPWLFGFADVVAWPHVVVGAMEILIPAFTARHRSQAIEA